MLLHVSKLFSFWDKGEQTQCLTHAKHRVHQWATTIGLNVTQLISWFLEFNINCSTPWIIKKFYSKSVFLKIRNAFLRIFTNKMHQQSWSIFCYILSNKRKISHENEKRREQKQEATSFHFLNLQETRLIMYVLKIGKARPKFFPQ